MENCSNNNVQKLFSGDSPCVAILTIKIGKRAKITFGCLLLLFRIPSTATARRTYIQASELGLVIKAWRPKVN